MNENYINNESFSFGNFGSEKDLNYSNISGLGESDYENEDLFSNEIETNISNRINNDFVGEPFKSSFSSDSYDTPESLQNIPNLNNSIEENNKFQVNMSVASSLENPEVSEEKVVEEPEVLEEKVEEPEILEEKVEEPKVLEELPREENKTLLTDTPIEELQKLTEYTEEKINSTDINSLFNKVGVNVKEASDIFKRNTEMKEKIDSRFEELKKLQHEIENSKKNQYDEINAYKEEVLSKLTEKKEEIEKRLNKLKEYQSNLEKEKLEFEQYRKKEKEEINRVQKEIQEAYDSRRDELSHIEDVLRKQKDSLDEERSQLSLDMIQYESDKNELANNLLKFNEIVSSFTNGMEKINKE